MPVSTACYELASFAGPLSPSDRERGLAHYLEFLQARNGLHDLRARTLSAREAFFAKLSGEPVRSKLELDRGAFYRNLNRHPEPDLDPRIVWLLAAAKANQSERFAVDLLLAETGLRASYGAHSQFMFLEEVYHTRFLLDACRACGLEFEMANPPPTLRVFIRLLESLPERFNLPMSYCGELIGVVLFDLLREKTSLFEEQPELAERLRTLVDEILIDEVGHLLYARLRLGRFGLAASRALLAPVARSLQKQVPEFALLAGGPAALVERVKRFDVACLPEGVSFPVQLPTLA